MHLRTIISALCFSAFSASLTACGSSTPPVKTSSERSVGQQLTDLEQAHQQGIITAREYARLKKAIIKAND